MPSKEDYEAMNHDAAELMGAIETVSGIAQRMAAFSATLLAEQGGNGRKGRGR